MFKIPLTQLGASHTRNPIVNIINIPVKFRGCWRISQQF